MTEAVSVGATDVPADRAARTRVERDGSTVTLRLVRGERFNAIDLGFAQDFSRDARLVVEAVEGGAGCLLVVSEGTHFCVGGDIRDFPTGAEEATVHLGRMAALVHEAFASLWELPVPIVTAVQGSAAGAGIGLALLGDIVIVADDARFRSAYTAVGLSPDCGVSWLLPRAVGERAAMDLVLTNRTVAADEALRMGLVSRVVPAGELVAEATSAVAKIVAIGTAAGRTSKRLLRQSADDSLRAHLADEAVSIAARAADDHARALRAEFLAGSGRR